MTKTLPDLARRWFARQPETLSELEQQVLQSAIDRKPIARDTSASHGENRTLGDRLADGTAHFGGSWRFIISFGLFLLFWAIANAWLLGRDAFDPYPFIFLNLVLSMLAAVQAPIIMMSQNRQAERDRLDAAHDYAVNLKAEIEIMALHEKFDELRHRDVLSLRDAIEDLSNRLKAIEAAVSRRS